MPDGENILADFYRARRDSRAMPTFPITRNALSSDGPPLHLASASSASRPKPKASLAVGGEGEGAAPACEWGGGDLSSGGTEAGLRSGRVWSKNDWLSSSNLQ